MVIGSKPLKVKLPALVAVEITGEGIASDEYGGCEVYVGGSLYVAAVTDISVQQGDTITFSVWGASGNTQTIGTVTIDGVTVLSVTSRTTETYDWIVPEGIDVITINLAIHASPFGYSGNITVTTS